MRWHISGPAEWPHCGRRWPYRGHPCTRRPHPVAVSLGRFRVESGGIGQIDDGLVELALHEVNRPPRLVSLGGLRVEPDRLAGVLDGFVEFNLHTMAGRKLDVRFAAFRIEQNRPRAISNALVHFAQEGARQPSVGVCTRAFRIDLDGPGGIRDRSRPLFFVEKNRASIAVGVRAGWVQSDYFGECLFGGRVVLLLTQRLSFGQQVLFHARKSKGAAHKKDHRHEASRGERPGEPGWKRVAINSRNSCRATPGKRRLSC